MSEVFEQTDRGLAHPAFQRLSVEKGVRENLVQRDWNQCATERQRGEV